MVVEVLGPTRRNLITLAGLAAILVATHVVYPHRVLQYAAYLAIFSIWMAWFVFTFVDVIDIVDA